MTKISLKKKYFVVFLLLALLTMNLFAIHYGLPQQLNPDEKFFVKGAGRMLRHPYLDPKWYGAPASTLMDALASTFASYAAIQLLSGTSKKEVVESFYYDPTIY